MLLNCHTYFSLRYGTFSEKELIRIALDSGYKQVALTDINNTSACLNFVRLSQRHGLLPTVGIDFRNGSKQMYVGIAKNNKGFLELNRFLSSHLHNKTSFPKQAPEMENVFIIYPFEQYIIQNRSNLYQNEYIGVSYIDIHKILFSQYLYLKSKMLILHSLTFRHKQDYNVHRLLRSIDENILLSKLPTSKFPQQFKFIPSVVEMKKIYSNLPFLFPQTISLLEQCTIYFDFSKSRKPQNKNDFSGNLAKDYELLNSFCQQGIPYRYKKITPQIESRLENELHLIKLMGFVPFFLINHDIIRYAKKKGYFHVGRGSGANSIVAYLLGITDVDPIELDLYFERFINLYRTNPPDFDIDFSWRDRQDVTRYIFEKYGNQGQTALLATYNTFQRRGAIREIGKIFGMPKYEIDILCSGNYSYNSLDRLSQLTHLYANKINGIPNHLSIHTGGILISEKPINYFSATSIPPKGFPTVQFDMVIAEDVGLYKYDILGQRGLAKIKDAIDIVNANRSNVPPIDIHDVKSFFQDKNINQMISKAQCIGCFYVESPAMRMILKKLEISSYKGLVAASSIIRPGVAKSGMMREYILRHKFPEKRKDAHPLIYGLMRDTYGIMIYQEDVIKVAHHFAGLDLGKADILRRGMSGKFRSREEFSKVKDLFFKQAINKGHKCFTVLKIWKQIESFAGYAFAKGHSASYAIESYQCLFLKYYYPLEYMVATINNGGGYYRLEIYIYEAKKLGGIIHAPDINKSKLETIIEGKDIYLGFQLLHGLEKKLAKNIVSERDNYGDYISLENFLDRVEICMEQLDILIRIDAFRFTTQFKRNLLWKAHMLIRRAPNKVQRLIFMDEIQQLDIPTLPHSTSDIFFDEMELLGFSLQNPFTKLKNPIDLKYKARKFREQIGKIITIAGYLVAKKTALTSKGLPMYFGTFLDYEGQWIDTVHFPSIAKKYPFKGIGIYDLKGVVIEEFKFYCLKIISMKKLPYIDDTRYH